MTDGWADAIAGFAVVIAGASAIYARGAKDEAKRVADAEVGRDHLMYEPQRTGQFVNEGGMLFYEFRLPRRYALAARTSGLGGAVHNDLQLGQRSIDGTWRLPIDTWHRQRTAPQWDSVTVRFWPPEPATGQPEPWVCPCGRDPAPTADRPGHWQWDFGLPQNADQVLERRTA